MRKFLTVLIALLALLAVALPALGGDDHDLWCHFDQGTPGELRGSTAQGEGHKNHELDFKIKTDEDLAACVGEETTTTIPEETTTTEATTTTLPLTIEVCRDEAIVFIDPAELLDTDERIFNDQHRNHCLPNVPTVPNPTNPGLPIIVFPDDPGTGWVCVGSDNVITEVPRDSNPLVEIFDTPEEAQAGCPATAEIPAVIIAPVSTVATVLPFTGPSDMVPFLALAGLAALSLGGLMVRSARSDG